MDAQHENPVRIGEVTRRFTTTGSASGYQIEVWHDGLNEHRVLSDRDIGVLQNKLRAQLSRWYDKYEKHLEREERAARRHAGLSAAEAATAEAQHALQACRNILQHTLDVDDRVDWESLKDHAPMTRDPRGTEGIEYHRETGKPIAYRRAVQPSGTAPNYDPPLFSLLDHFFSSRRNRKEEAARIAFERAQQRWQDELDRADRIDEECQATLNAEQNEWAVQEADYKARQDAANAEVDTFRWNYEQGVSDDGRAVEEHAELVLNASTYPDWFSVDFELGYNVSTKTIVIEYRLPLEDSIPTVKSVSYIQSRDELKKSFISEREKTAIYESMLYQIALRTIHELCEADEVPAFDAVVFNGWVESVDPATGQMRDSCIMSVQARREEFLSLNLAEVEPRACYRALKGVSAAKLATLTPVQPILHLDTGDRRFVESREVAQNLSAESNLATMDWESFEHLVREIFEQEFVVEGGEVKVTQASRDGGVDAVAFDPDPIRGGKYVIQAKRFTRTVGVAAVRDLYGTVIHEGADRGILVTTSDYGADSVSFAKDKPLTLINGAQLLSLLEKHGHRARIDLREARELQAYGNP